MFSEQPLEEFLDRLSTMKADFIGEEPKRMIRSG
jgi:hypothetical protein